ncbi:MAG: acyl-CoA dehydratase activase-related protein [bacterium]
MKIGIPRALFYWKNPFFWEEFFKTLGEEVVLSPKTNKEIVLLGTKASDPETCFSMKVFFGHVIWLEGKVDRIFVPLLKTDQSKLEYCPKFFGLPDLAKILVETPVLSEVIDQKRKPLEKSLMSIGRALKKDRQTINKAIEAALLSEKQLVEEEERSFFQKVKSNKKKLILISHPYNLYDDYINVGMKEKLEALNIEPIYINEVPEYFLKNESDIKFHWEFGKKMMQKTNEILNYDISGAIEISSFQCGCDAALKEFIENKFKQAKVPFLYLVIDEQAGDAGLQTRLEAFVDTLK